MRNRPDYRLVVALAFAAALLAGGCQATKTPVQKLADANASVTLAYDTISNARTAGWITQAQIAK